MFFRDYSCMNFTLYVILLRKDLYWRICSMTTSLHAVDSAMSNYGIIAYQRLQKFYEEGVISSVKPLAEKQLQPASMDLRLGGKAYRVRAGFLPGKNATVMNRVASLHMHEIDLTDGGVLERGAVYIVPLQEKLNLPTDVSGIISPKSSTGRLDILTRLITDNGISFDKIEKGFSGDLYLEITPLTFSVIAREGDCLTQLRLRQGKSVLEDSQLQELHAEHPLVYVNDHVEEPMLDHGLWLSVDLEGRDSNAIVGYRSRKSAPLIDLRKINHYHIEDFWEPIVRPSSGQLILDPEEFYILASRERIVIPNSYSCEMMPYETTAGELRVHYAGFFDPGFGVFPDGRQGRRGVLEVRSHDVPFVLEHGQKICRMVYENMQELPSLSYGEVPGSNYSNQSLKLGKQFKDK